MKRLITLLFLLNLNIWGQPSVQLKWISNYPVVDSVNTYLSAGSRNTAVDKEGNLYTLTSLISEDFPFYRFKLNKYNSSGIFLWQVESNNIELKNYVADIIELDNSGNIYIASHTYENDLPSGTYILKFNSVGVMQWIQEYNGNLSNSYSLPLYLKFDRNSNVIVLGYSGRIENKSPKPDSLYILKYNMFGSLLWSAVTMNDSLTNMVQCKLDKSDNICLTGISSIFSHQINIVKYSNGGKRTWKSTYYNKNFYFNPSDLTPDENLNCFVTGTASTLNFNTKWITIKFDEKGSRKWINYEDKDSLSDVYESPLLIKVDEKNFVNVLGYANKNNISNFFYVIYDTSGSKISDKHYSDTTKEYIQRVTLDQNGNLYTAGFFQNPDKVYLSKFDITGNKLWSNSFTTGGIKNEDNGMNLILGGTEFIYLTTEDSSKKAGIHEVISSKYNNSGKEIWTVRSNGFLRHQVTSMVTDYTGNTFLTGWIENGKGNNQDFITIKFDSSGNDIWMSRYDGPAHSNDLPNAINLDAEGNVYVTGGSDGINSGQDYITIKYNQLGKVVWQMRYDGPGNDSDNAQGIAFDDENNVYVTGSSIGADTYYDFATIKYNKFGQLQWIRRFDNFSSGKDSAASISIDPLGNIYVAGTSDSTKSLHTFMVVKYSSSGDVIWTRRYHEKGNEWEKARKMIIDKSSNVYVIGTSFTNGSKENITTIKYNSAGKLQWAAKWDDPSNSSDEASDIRVDGKGNVFVTGYGPGGGTGKDFVTLKYNSLGKIKWGVTYNGIQNSDDITTNMALDYEGNVYIIGFTVDNNSYSLVKYDTNGIKMWDENYILIPSSGAASIGINVDNNGNIIIGGYSGNSNWSVLNLLKYSQPGFIPTGISANSNKKLKFILFQNFPNPFNPATTIKYSIPKTSFVTLKLFDILGREVKTLISKEISEGNYELKFDGYNLSSGVYLYTLRAGDFIETRKMLILK